MAPAASSAASTPGGRAWAWAWAARAKVKANTNQGAECMCLCQCHPHGLCLISVACRLLRACSRPILIVGHRRSAPFRSRVHSDTQARGHRQRRPATEQGRASEIGLAYMKSGLNVHPTMEKLGHWADRNYESKHCITTSGHPGHPSQCHHDHELTRLRRLRPKYATSLSTTPPGHPTMTRQMSSMRSHARLPVTPSHTSRTAVLSRHRGEAGERQSES